MMSESIRRSIPVIENEGMRPQSKDLRPTETLVLFGVLCLVPVGVLAFLEEFVIREEGQWCAELGLSG